MIQRIGHVDGSIDLIASQIRGFSARIELLQ